MAHQHAHSTGAMLNPFHDFVLEMEPGVARTERVTNPLTWVMVTVLLQGNFTITM